MKKETYDTELYDGFPECEAPCNPVVCEDCPFGELGDDPE